MKKITFLIFMTLGFISFGQDMILSGILDGPLPGGLPKAIEIYVVNDIPDISVYGIESTTNGAASAGTPEFIFPQQAATAGSYIYVSTEEPLFTQYLGIAPTFTNGVAGVNGDDPILLYKDGAAYDMYGTFEDGSGTVWDYLDGWAYRKNNTTANLTFDSANWVFSGINAVDGCDLADDSGTNAGCSSVFPLGTFNPSSTDPSLSIDSPANSSIINDTALNVEVSITNFDITQDANDPKDGYVYYKLFENGTDTSVQPNLEDSSSSTTISLTNLIEGTHTLEVSLVDNSFTALNPAVSQTISFTVSLGQVCFDLSSGQELFDIITVTPNSQSDEWSLSNGTYSMNGYVGSGVQENVESWLVFGPLDMSGASGTKLEFDLGESFGATDLVIAVSTDYSSCPSSANWTTVTTLTDPGFISLDLSSVTDSNVFIGVQYADDGVDGYSGYTMSNVVMKSSGACPSLGQRPVSDCGTCDLILGTAGIVCGTNTVGDNNDSVTITIPYSGVEASITSVTTTSNGQIGGDDPAAVADGTITISGLSEGDAWDITINGGDCDGTTLNGTVAASNCDPVAIVINEILADPAGDITGDSNGDGTRNGTEDEFIEFYNTGSADFDISGYVISDGSNGGDNTRHTFEQGTVIPANSFLIVFGGGTPTGFANGTAIVSSSGSLGLNNGTDSVILKNASGGVVLQVDYTDGGNDQSVGRSPDFTGNFVLHTSISPNALFSPGLENDDPSLSLQGALKNMFKVYPNPVSNGTVTITSQFTETITATVFDILGKEVINERVNNNTLDVSQLNKGIYLMKLTQNGASATQKLVIK